MYRTDGPVVIKVPCFSQFPIPLEQFSPQQQIRDVLLIFVYYSMGTPQLWGGGHI